MLLKTTAVLLQIIIPGILSLPTQDESYINLSKFRPNSESTSNSKINYIDIYTNHPDRHEIIKNYRLFLKGTTDGNSQVTEAPRTARRSYDNLYDSYEDQSTNYGYKNRRPASVSSPTSSYYNKYPDRLESEHGVFDSDLPSGTISTTTERPRRKKKYIYVGGSSDRFSFNGVSPSSHQYYSVANQQGTHDDNDRFKDKLNQFMVAMNRPKFQTGGARNITTSPSGQGAFETSTRVPRPIEGSTGLDSSSSDRYATRNRLNRILRNYLVKMHKNKYGGTASSTYRLDDNRPHNPRPNTNNNHLYESGKTINHVVVDSYHANIDRNAYVDKFEGKFLAEPLAQIKNKTLKFASKFLSLFTVIQFENSKCQASNAMGNYEGTCFLPSECEEKGGTALGKCASGHGVCCVFKGTCGGSSAENCTYFESPNYPDYYPGGGVIVPPVVTPSPLPTPDPRDKLLYDIVENEDNYLESRQSAGDLGTAMACAFSVSKTSEEVKQMRIDFIDLELKGPTNGTCVAEKLVITGMNINNQVPAICGYNTGQHVYVDVSGMTGPLTLQVLSTVIERKRFKIRICQFADACTSSMGCLQYYTGLEGLISTFNYDQAVSFSRSMPGYFNNLNYAICIKRMPGYCTVTYSTTDLSGNMYPFQLDNFDDTGMRTVPVGQAGAGVFNCPDDYIVINGIRLCGQRLNDGSVNVDFTKNAPVTDFSNGPIVIPVRTSSAATGRGFKLFYMQNRCR